MNRRQFLQGTAALFCAPAIVKADNLMKIWVPPHTVTFTLNGIAAGDSIALIDPLTNEVIVNEMANVAPFSKTIVYEKDREVIVRVRNGGESPILPFQTNAFVDEQGLDLTMMRVLDKVWL